MIQEGLLWFDDDPKRQATDKVERAAQRYTQKYGHGPDVCYVHESEIRAQIKAGETMHVGDVKVLPAKSVLPHHFWLGVEDRTTKDKKKDEARA